MVHSTFARLLGQIEMPASAKCRRRQCSHLSLRDFPVPTQVLLEIYTPPVFEIVSESDPSEDDGDPPSFALSPSCKRTER